MKFSKVFSLSIFIIAAGATYSADAAAPHLYANYISAHNINAMQHSIMTQAMQTFEGAAAAALSGHSKFIQKIKSEGKGSALDLYGHLPMYGTMHLYGEYGDDGSVNYDQPKGRNGGDTYSRPTLNSMWLTWNHFDEDVKFKTYDVLDSDYDLIMFGFAGGEAQLGIGISEWGFFGGYTGGEQTNEFLNIEETGGYVGFYSGYNIQNFNLSFAINAGSLYNNAENIYGTDEYANMWAGAALNATYNISLDDTFTLQPGIYAGYTWIGSANYISASGDSVENQNFNMLEITPSLRAIKHISKGWFGYIGVKYVLNYPHGGDVLANGVLLQELDIDNYSEYGIGIEKSIDRFNVAIHLNRHDGGRYGWNGGFNLKYIF